MPGGRFFGFVIGGTHPAALAVDWLVSAWDQNSGLRMLTPAHSAIEDVTEAWLVDLLGLPAGSAVGFVTGGTMANFTCLAAGRDEVLRRAGWDVAERGLVGSPGVRVLVGAERHDTIDLSLRYLGLGAPEPVAADDQGRIEPAALAAALDAGDGRPTIVCLQAGNVHSGAFDPFDATIAAAHDAGAWVHVDGAFGLFAGASPRRRHLMAGSEPRRLLGDRRPQDPQRAVRLRAGDRARPGGAAGRDGHARRLPHPRRGGRAVRQGAGDQPPGPGLPRLGRAARRWDATGWPTWSTASATTRRLRRGDRRDRGGQVLNDVDFTQVCASFGDDDAHPGRGRGDAQRRDGLDDRVALARAGRAAGEREQLVDDRRRRRVSLAALHRAAGH